jgi:hypothetical protein
MAIVRPYRVTGIVISGGHQRDYENVVDAYTAEDAITQAKLELWNDAETLVCIRVKPDITGKEV